MPLIACHHCKSRFKVNIDTLGGTVKCPKCKKPFKAVALHSAPRGSHGTPPIAYAGIVVGSLLVALFIFKVVGGSADEPVEEAPKAKASATKSTPANDAPASDPSESSGGMKGALEDRARKILEAMRAVDDPELPRWIDYPRMHSEQAGDGVEGTPWTALTEAQKYAARIELLEALLGEPAVREFSRHAAIDQLEVKQMGQGHAEVSAHLKNPLTEKGHDVAMRFSISGGTWKLYALDRIYPEPTAEEAAIAAGPVELPKIPSRSSEADPVAVEMVEGTSSSTMRVIEGAIRRLTDPKATTDAGRARRELVEIGKAAIPPLLNQLVPLDLEQQDDLIIAVRVSQALIELTGEPYPIVPGTNEGSVIGEGAADNEKHRRRWFGWWKNNHGSYTGPPTIDDNL